MRDIVSPLAGFSSPFGRGADPYAILGYKPPLVLDYENSKFRVSGSTSTAPNVVTATRTGLATQLDASGNLVWNAHNLALNSATPATQSITVVSGADYTVECTGSGSITLSGAGTGSVTAGNPVEITASTTTLTLTVVGSLDTMWAYRSDLGGMAPVPLTRRVAGSTTYVPTTSAAVYLPREEAYIYDANTAKWNAHNLITYSEEFDNASWSKINTTITANNTTSPDGTLTADKIIEGAANSSHDVRRSNIFGAGTYTFSVFAKASERNHILLGCFSSPVRGTRFNLSTGVVEGPAATYKAADSASIQDFGNGWYLCSITQTVTNTQSFFIGLSTGTANFYVGDGTSGVFIWGAHLYRSDLNGVVANSGNSVSGLYVPTEGTAVQPTLADVSFAGPYYQKESDARTNLLHTTNALVTQTLTVTAVPHTLHFTGTGTVTLLGVSAAGPLVGTGTGENNRVSLTFTPTAGILTLTVSGTVSDAQLEVGSTLSSYIPNLAASGTVTRSADSTTISAENMPVYTNALSFQMEGLMTGESSTFADWTLDANNGIQITSGASDFTFTQEAAGVVDSVTGGSYTSGVNTPFNIASRHGSTFVNGAVDGTALTADTTPTALPDLSATTFNLAPTFNGFIKEFRVWGADIGDTGIAEAST